MIAHTMDYNLLLDRKIYLYQETPAPLPAVICPICSSKEAHQPSIQAYLYIRIQGKAFGPV